MDTGYTMITNDQIEEAKYSAIFEHINSVEEIRDWIYVYLGIWFPDNVVFHTSTHSPIQALYTIYDAIRTGKTEDVPEFVMLAARDSGKTLISSVLELLCMVHFRIAICHLAAIEQQAQKGVKYTSRFFKLIEKYLFRAGWAKTGDNKRTIEWRTPEQEDVYLKILVATLASVNSDHVPLMIIDEIDLISDPNVLQEAKMICSTYKKFHPCTVYLSTRKFAGGLMEQTIEDVQRAGGQILRWNTVDITERITHEAAKIDEPKVLRYINREYLPLGNISPEEFKQLNETQQAGYEEFLAYSGISLSPLLSVMRNYLVDRPQQDFGGFFKPLSFLRNQFNKLDVDIAKAQVLCEKPASHGLVYRRFDTSNIITMEAAYERVMGEPPKQKFTLETFRIWIHNLGARIYGGADWGFTDFVSLSIIAILPGEEAWLVYNFLEQGMEIDDIDKQCKAINNIWKVEAWYCDNNYPTYLSKLRKPNDYREGLKIPEFVKDVSAGISALQTKIMNSNGKRKFFVINASDNNSDAVTNAFSKYRWELDARGNIKEGVPHHDKKGVSDILDSIRYPSQNLFGGKKKIAYTSSTSEKDNDTNKTLIKAAEEFNKVLMANKINELAPRPTGEMAPSKVTKKRIMW